MRGMQVGIHRTSDRTIEFFTQHEIVAEGTWLPVTISALGTMDGTDNFTDSYSPGLGAVISRTLGRARCAVPRTDLGEQLEPAAVRSGGTQRHFPDGHGRAHPRASDRLPCVRGRTSRVWERSGIALISFGLEKRSGGHMFQLTITNGFGTTMGQVARGGINTDDWHLGFSISRKFLLEKGREGFSRDAVEKPSRPLFCRA